MLQAVSCNTVRRGCLRTSAKLVSYLGPVSARSCQGRPWGHSGSTWSQISDMPSTSGNMGETYFQEFGSKILTCTQLVGTWVKHIFRNLVSFVGISFLLPSPSCQAGSRWARACHNRRPTPDHRWRLHAPLVTLCSNVSRK